MNLFHISCGLLSGKNDVLVNPPLFLFGRQRLPSHASLYYYTHQAGITGSAEWHQFNNGSSCVLWSISTSWATILWLMLILPTQNLMYLNRTIKFLVMPNEAENQVKRSVCGQFEISANRHILCYFSCFHIYQSARICSHFFCSKSVMIVLTDSAWKLNASGLYFFSPLRWFWIQVQLSPNWGSSTSRGLQAL